jgi:hypothetical protein
LVILDIGFASCSVGSGPQSSCFRLPAIAGIQVYLIKPISFVIEIGVS